MMKKILLVINIFILFLGVDVLAENRFSVNDIKTNNMSEEIQEEIEPIYKDSYIVGFNISIIIPSTYDKDDILISPNLFNGINHYKNMIPGEEIFIDLKIMNHSNYNYKYIKNSFKITTDDLSKYNDNNIIIGKGFDNKDIYDYFSIYRVYNEAIKDLYKDEYHEEYLQNENLDRKLKNIGYSLDSIDKYYLDYFNNKYHLKEKDLNDFTYSTIKEIFTGEIGNYQEENNYINSLAYNYYYNKLLYILLDDIEVDQFESDNYSIGEYMRNNNLCNSFELNDIDSKNEINKKIRLGINEYYYSEIFNDYNLFGHLEFRLEKSDYIDAPNTGV